MKQSTKQINRQSLVLTPLLQNKIKLLSLSGYEIRLRLKQEIEDQCDKEEGDRDFSFFKDILKLESYSKNFSSGLNLQKEYLLILIAMSSISYSFYIKSNQKIIR